MAAQQHLDDMPHDAARRAACGSVAAIAALLDEVGPQVLDTMGDVLARRRGGTIHDRSGPVETHDGWLNVAELQFWWNHANVAQGKPVTAPDYYQNNAAYAPRQLTDGGWLSAGCR